MKFAETLRKLRTLEAVPEALRTAKLCRKYVNKNGRDLASVPWERLHLSDAEAAELCRLAVKQSAWAFEFVPDKWKTPELCMEAVTGDALETMLAFVPEELKTLELCVAAVETPVFDDPYQYVPPHLREQVREIAKKNAEKMPKAFYAKYNTKQFGQIVFHVFPGAAYGTADVHYNDQRIELFIPDIWKRTDKITPCLEIIEKYFEINDRAKNALLINFKENKTIRGYFRYNFKNMDNEERIKTFSTVKYRKIDFPGIIKNLSYPILFIGLTDDKNELKVNLSYVLAKDSILRGHILEVKMDGNLTVSGFEHGRVLLD